VTCHNCRSECKRHGRDRKGNQRFQCRQCSKTFLEPQDKPLEGMYLPLDKAELILKLMVDGNSLSAISRITDVHLGTITKLLVLVAEKCERIMGRCVRNVCVRDVEMDEVWAFIGKKQKRVRPEDDQNMGDAYTFVAIERHSKLVLNIAMGKRDQVTTDVFVEGVRQAIAPRQHFQVTTDGFAPYRSAITTTLSDCADFAQLIKVYRAAPDGERKYAPLKFSLLKWSQLWASPILNGFARQSWSGRT